MTFYKLISRKDYGTIVRAADARNQAEFDKKDRKWYRSGVMLLYFAPYDDNPYYDLYEEISEDEARKAVEKYGVDLYEPAVYKFDDK